MSAKVPFGSPVRMSADRIPEMARLDMRALKWASRHISAAEIAS